MPQRLPQQIIDEILQRTDIVELVGSYLTLKKQGQNYFGLCPFHSEDTPSFSVAPGKQIYYCFGCQKGGNAINFLMELEALTFGEAAAKLAERAGVQIPQKELSPAQSRQAKERQSILTAHQLTAEFYRELLQRQPNPAVDYLGKRGIGEQVIKSFALGYAGDDWQALYNYLNKRGYDGALLQKASLVSLSGKNNRFYDKFHSRLIFPICDFRGEVIALGGRVLDDSQPKYLNSAQTPVYNKSAVLFGLHIAADTIRREDLAVIMEGYIDVVTAHQYGVTNAVASLGTALTAEQAKLLKRYTTNVLLAYDGDSAGEKASLRGLDILREQGMRVRVLSLPDGCDPDDFLRQKGFDGWQKLVADEAYDILEYLLRQAMKKYDASSASGKGLIVKELLPAIAKTASSVERESFIQLLASRLQVATENVYADLRKSGLAVAMPKSNNRLAPDFGNNITVKSSASAQLLRLMLENLQICRLALAELGDNFGANEQENSLLKYLKERQNDDNLNIFSLLNCFEGENEGLKSFLLKLLQINIPDQITDKLALEYINAVRLGVIRQQINAVNGQIAAGQGDMRQLLTELDSLQRQIQRIKG